MKIASTRFNFATTLGIISGHPRFDNQAAAIIDRIQSRSKEPVQFVGVIGDKDANKLSKVYGSSKQLQHEEVVINRNTNLGIQDFIVNPYRIVTHLLNYSLLQKLNRQEFFEDLYQRNISALIIVGNYPLMRRTFTRLNQLYEQKNVEKPLRLGFDLMNAYYTMDQQNYIDFLYHNLARKPENITGYIFPSMCIGYEGLFKAFQFLQKHRADSTNNSFLSTQFTYEVSQLVAKARGQYRASKGLNQDKYITLVAPGNQERQIQFTFSRLNKAVKQFSEDPEIINVNKDFFKLFILLPDDSKLAGLIKEKAAPLSSTYEVSFIPSSQKYGAMCAADYSVLHTGEITVQAAACQLPAVVLSSMSNYKAYISYLYNGHQSPLNVATNQEAYQDLLGSLTAIPYKIKTLMLDNYRNPKIRFYYAKLYREQIQNQLSQNGRNPSLNVSQTGLQVAADDILHKISLRSSFNTTSPLNRYQRKQRLQLL